MKKTENNAQKLLDLGEHLKESLSPDSPFILNSKKLKAKIKSIGINGSFWAITIEFELFTAVIECSSQKEMTEIKRKLQNHKDIELYVRSDKRFLAPMNNIKKDRFITPLWKSPGFLVSKNFPIFQDGRIIVDA